MASRTLVQPLLPGIRPLLGALTPIRDPEGKRAQKAASGERTGGGPRSDQPARSGTALGGEMALTRPSTERDGWTLPNHRRARTKSNRSRRIPDRAAVRNSPTERAAGTPDQAPAIGVCVGPIVSATCSRPPRVSSPASTAEHKIQDPTNRSDHPGRGAPAARPRQPPRNRRPAPTVRHSSTQTETREAPGPCRATAYARR